MRSARRSLTILALAASLLAALASLAGSSRLRAAVPSVPSLDVRASRVDLPAGDPLRGRVGALVFRGGLLLESEDPHFGGLSDLRLSADGQRMAAVSDCGYGFSAELVYDELGAPSGIHAPRLVVLAGPGGRALRAGENDAECLVADGPFLEVGFEGRGRVWRYSAEPPFGPPVDALPAPPGLARCGPNLGLEAMTRLGDGRRLLVCEGERTPALTVPAWVGTPGAWTERRYPLHFEGGWAGQPFRPTGATTLDDGDVLVVERRFPPFGTRLVRVPRASLESSATGPLVTVEVASLASSSLVENYESIEARRDESGRTLVYLLSDDNGCAKPGSGGVGLTRARLLLFELVASQPASAIGS